MFEKVEVANSSPERSASCQGNFYQPLEDQLGPGMNRRIQRLRKLTFDAEPTISIER